VRVRPIIEAIISKARPMMKCGITKPHFAAATSAVATGAGYVFVVDSELGLANHHSLLPVHYAFRTKHRDGQLRNPMA
jgi:hypothetical protein